MAKIEFLEQENLSVLQQQYGYCGVVQVKKVLLASSAELIYQHIATQKQWNLVLNQQGQHLDLNAEQVETWTEQQKKDLQQIVYQQAETGFAYHYKTIPIYDIYYKKLMPNHFFNEIMAFLNADDTLAWFRDLLNEPDISFVDGQITCFEAGHFLNLHDDNVAGKNRVAAMVINLTPNWRVDWGGALHLLDEQNRVSHCFLPEFNTMNIFKVPTPHFVGAVAPFVTKARYAITGWLRKGKNPLE